MTVAAIGMLRADLSEAGISFDHFTVAQVQHQSVRHPVLSVTVGYPDTLPKVKRVLNECAPGVPVLEASPHELLLRTTKLPPAVPLAELDQWQTSSPTGGFVHSVWVGARDLARGQLVRWNWGWAAITAIETVSKNLAVQVLAIVDDQRKLLWSTRWSDAGMEVRTDMRIKREDVL